LVSASAFDSRQIMNYLIGRAEGAAIALKSAISKVFGIYDAGEELIHIDHSVRKSKQNFLKLHEAGHHEFPTHRKVYRVHPSKGTEVRGLGRSSRHERRSSRHENDVRRAAMRRTYSGRAKTL
jgi:hypothetical protein